LRGILRRARLEELRRIAGIGRDVGQARIDDCGGADQPQEGERRKCIDNARYRRAGSTLYVWALPQTVAGGM